MGDDVAPLLLHPGYERLGEIGPAPGQRAQHGEGQHAETIDGGIRQGLCLYPRGGLELVDIVTHCRRNRAVRIGKYYRDSHSLGKTSRDKSQLLHNRAEQ